MWDKPISCAKFIDTFTSHNLKDSQEFNLNRFTRKDLEGIIHLLHGYYSQFVSENPELEECLHCNFTEVLEAMALAESLFIDEFGELCIDDLSWEKVKDNHYFTKVVSQLSSIT